VLDSQYFDVAQRRERVFAVGHLGDWRYPAAVLLEPESLCGNHPPSRQAQQDVAGSLAASTGGSDENDARDGRLIAFGGNDTRGPIEVATARNAHGGPHGRLDFESETFVCFDTTQITSKENRCQPQPGAPCHPLAAQAHPPTIAFDARQSDVIQYGEKTGPLDTDQQTYGVLSGPSVRRLLPVETERLQAFEDNYTAITYRGKPAADGPRYRAIGNSMSVTVIRWILRRIEVVDAKSLDVVTL
jgi:DNA (cytosine-5)-methyltransferase 1